MPNVGSKSISLPQAAPPRVGLQQLDSLWFQITGTLCNLECTHCFVSCSPENHSFGFIDYDRVIEALRESVTLGVKEYYFTGGEPFMHPRLIDILRQTLRIGPATVLTNGTLFRDRTIDELADLRDGSIYSLELRVSIDGPNAAANDPIRGEGTFDRAMDGVRRLVQAGFLPIITMANMTEAVEDAELYRTMRQALLAIGYARPRIKILPSLRLGAEVARWRGYRNGERVTAEMMRDYDSSRLICSTSRIVTDRGVHVCPILIEQPDSVLGQTLAQACASDYALRHQACYTCWLHGAICANAPANSMDR